MTDEYSSNIGNDTPIGQTVMQRNKVTKHLGYTHLDIIMNYTFHTPFSYNPYIPSFELPY